MKNEILNAKYQVGEKFSQSFDFTAENVKSFASLAGDASPLHHDEEFARNSRFGGLIVSGTHYSALMMGMVATFLTKRGSGLGLEFNFQFRKAVLARENVTAVWSITAVEPSAKLGGDLVTLEGVLQNRCGEVCVTATSKSLVLPLEAI